jgi:hypothetical protein
MKKKRAWEGMRRKEKSRIGEKKLKVKLSP